MPRKLAFDPTPTPIILCWAVATLAAAACTATVSAAEVRSATGRGTQFVLVIDDSGSMKGDDGEAADPDRLSIFAARSLLSMLDDSDEATVVRLNGARDGEKPQPIASLAVNRADLEQRLRLDGGLARYAGQSTPCRTALAEVQVLLDRAWRMNVAQVVMFLTDGACTPRATEVPEVERFLAQVRSHREGLLRFYLLRFRGRPYTNELAQLARATDGQALEVSADDPTSLLEPFADALTRSQGFEAELLTPASSQLAAHRGARRVRLLAVAPGPGEPLGFAIADPQGRSPQRLGRVDSGTHRYGSGETYRFAALDYRPGDDPVTVRVTGAGERWKVVAVPEYRLFVEMSLRRGECGGDAGPALRHAVESGGTVCANVRLVNEQGRAVGRDAAGGDVRAAVRYGRGEEVDELPAEPVGDRAEFEFQRTRLESGDHVFQPVVTLRVPGGREESITLAGPRTLVQASTLEIRPNRGRFDFGALRAGDDAPPQELVLEGNFPRSQGVLQVVNREAIPSCVTFTVGGQSEGKPLPVVAGQPYPLAVHVAPYCGPQAIDRRFEPTLRLAFEGTDGGLELPAVEVVTDLHLDWRIATPRAVELSLRAGDDLRVPLAIDTNATRPLHLFALLEPAAERPGWPADDLVLRFTDGEDGMAFVVPPGGAAEPVALALASDTCCASGEYRTLIEIGPADGSAYGGAAPDPLRVPVRVQVASAGVWACWGRRVLWLLALLALVLAVLYVVSMVRNSTFLDRDLLAEKLVPLRWDGYGTPQRWTRDAEEVRSMVRRALPLHQRALAWLKANPLVFGLPGRRYQETVELELAPERGIDRSRIRLLADRELYRRLEAEPASGEGRLFAHSQGRGGIDFFAVPHGGRLGRLTPARLAEWEPSADSKKRVLRLKRKEQLIHSIPDRDRREGTAAGWQVG